jgi:iron complex outermembrane receptor protein
MSRSKYLQRVVHLSLVTSALGFAAPSSAQEAAADKSAATLGSVIVTAQKRDETLTEVPIAISVFTSEARDKLGVTSVLDMSNFTPGFVYNQGQDRVSMRGIGRYSNQLGADSSVGVYEDGVFETFTVKAGNSSLYTDHIEVLRGPQGTLYGRASIGGAVNIISRRPTKEWYSEVRLSYGSYGNHIEEGAISGPITDNMQFRVVATKYDQTDGYFKNLGGGPSSGNVRDEWVYEGQLAWQLGEKDDLWLKVFGGSWDNGGGNAGGKTTNQVVVGADGNTPTPNGIYPANGPGFTTTNIALIPSLGVGYVAPTRSTLNPTGVNPGNNNLREFYSNYNQTIELTDYYGAVLHYTHSFDGFDVKYIGGAQHYNYVENVEWGEGFQLATGLVSFQNPGDAAATYPNSLLFYQEKHSFSSNEVNVISTTSGPLQWVAGVYNFNEYYEQPEDVYMPGQAQLATPLNVLTFGPSPANPRRAATHGEGDGGARTLAGYGQLDWSFTDAWKATLGGRYSKDEKWGWDKGRLLAYNAAAGVGLDISELYLPLGVAYPGASPAVYDPATGIATRRLEGEWSGVTGTAGIQWSPDDQTNVYFKYSRGYKSGGFNIGSVIVSNPQTDAEHSNDFQLGFKRNFGNTFLLNVDVFYDQYYDAQLPIGVLQAGGLIATAFYNLPESRTSGVEVEATWQPTHELQFIFAYGFNDTEIVDSGCINDPLGDPTATRVGAQTNGCAAGSGLQNLNGNQLPNAPQNKVALNGNYTFDFSASSLTLSASYIWRDEQYGSIFNRPYTLAPSWDQTDVRVQFKTLQDHLTVIAYGKNVFDEIGYNLGARAAAQTDATGAQAGFIKSYDITPPATFGLEVQYKF